MSQPPETRNFNSWINLMPGAPTQLFVTGEVETPASNKQPRLTVSSNNPPNGVLLLDLSIQDTGNLGTQAFQFWPVRYEQPAARGQYTQVAIFWAGEELMRLDVSEVN